MPIKKALLLASVSPAALLLADGANAADMALKAAPPAASPAYSWTGCHVGVQMGVGWGRQKQTEMSSFSSTSRTNTLDSSGGLVGGQLGCDYQFSGNWVAGIQGDMEASDIKGTGSDPFGAIFGFGTTTVKTDWLASVTGRLGFTAWDNQALIYVKGGAAWERNHWDLSNADLFYSPSSFSETRGGWTVGGGIEYAITPVWSAFAEFDYYDFGHGGTTLSSTLSFFGFPGAPNTFTTGRQDIEAAKVGLNLKLGGLMK
jgi:outer membrane immunogenic protein